MRASRIDGRAALRFLRRDALTQPRPLLPIAENPRRVRDGRCWWRSLFGDSRFAQAVNDALVTRQAGGVVIARRAGPKPVRSG